jgi:hypothetical protein
VGVLGALLLALIAGGVGYWIAITTGAAPVAAGTVAVAPWGWGFPFFPFFGLLFLFLFIALIFSIARRTNGGRPGWYGPGRWYGYGHEHRSVPPAFEPMLEEWHRKAHGEPDPTPSGSRTGPA